ncbi:MAG: XRE family transcriptional regulator [Candidatus Aenigmatarchaeota archaeon]|nr:MAG: XRE family transcriptional regulator [Candidatus Aenigmarchaeota archaeon]
MASNLGSFLKRTREEKDMKLRVVEELVGISNAYLSQLENNKIANPSPKVLHKLAGCYGVSYVQLMQLAGYPAPGHDETAKKFRNSHLNNLTKDEEDKLSEYLLFLRTKKQQK